MSSISNRENPSEEADEHKIKRTNDSSASDTPGGPGIAIAHSDVSDQHQHQHQHQEFTDPEIRIKPLDDDDDDEHLEHEHPLFTDSDLLAALQSLGDDSGDEFDFNDNHNYDYNHVEAETKPDPEEELDGPLDSIQKGGIAAPDIRDQFDNYRHGDSDSDSDSGDWKDIIDHLRDESAETDTTLLLPAQDLIDAFDAGLNLYPASPSNNEPISGKADDFPAVGIDYYQNDEEHQDHLAWIENDSEVDNPNSLFLLQQTLESLFIGKSTGARIDHHNKNNDDLDIPVYNPAFLSGDYCLPCNSPTPSETSDPGCDCCQQYSTPTPSEPNDPVTIPLPVPVVTHTRHRGKPLSAFASPPISRDIVTIPESNDEEQIDNSNVDSIRIKSVDHLDDDDDDPIAAAFRASAQNINLDDILSKFSHFNMSGEPPAAPNPAAAVSEQIMANQENDANSQRLREQYGPSLYTSDVVDCAEPFLSAFGTKLFHPEEGQQALPASPPNQRTCIGHKETIFGLSFSDCGNFLATASQDSTVRIWDAKTNALLSTLKGHNIEYECLRVAWAPPNWGQQTAPNGETTKRGMVLASAGADGNVKLWSTDRDPREKPSWDCFATINHADYLDDARQRRSGDGEEEPAPQVYALQFINQWQGAMANPDSPIGSGTNGLLMTSSDDNIHFWEEVETTANKSVSKKLEQEVDLMDTKKGSSISEFMTIHFTAIERGFGGVFVRRVATSNVPVHKHQNGDEGEDDSEEEEEPSKSRFGGDRNPENIRYVFDASHCMANQLIGVALSDGSLRLVNSHGICVSILQLPGVESHLTSFSWDRTGTRLASCVATGHLILWDIDIRSQVNPSCVAVLEGGHVPGRPLFGAAYTGGKSKEDLLVTWGVDGRLCVWNSWCSGQIHSPIAILVDCSDYPMYAVDTSALDQTQESETSDLFSGVRLAVGGGREGGFLGIPAHLYDVNPLSNGVTRI